MLLFRTMTGESWQFIMRDCHISGDRCDPDHPDGSTCGSALNVVYFLTFSLITNCLVINILIAIIIDHFEFLYIDPSMLLPFHLENFVDEWRKLDPSGTGIIPYTWLPMLLKRLDPPLGVGKLCPQYALHRFLARLPVPINPLTKNIEFRSTLVSLIRVRQGMWLFNFPDDDDLHAIMRYIAPAAAEDDILKSIPTTKDAMEWALRIPVDAPESLWIGMTMRKLFTVIRMQRLYRINRRKTRVQNRIDELELKLAAFQVEHQIRTNAINSPEAHHAQNKNTVILHQYAAKATQRIKQLKLAINPAVTIAVALTKAHNDQDRRIRASGGKRRNLRNQWLAAMGKIKRTNLGAQIAKYDQVAMTGEPAVMVGTTHGGMSQYHDPIPLIDTQGHRPGAISAEPGLYHRPGSGVVQNPTLQQLQAQLAEQKRREATLAQMLRSAPPPASNRMFRDDAWQQR